MSPTQPKRCYLLIILLGTIVLCSCTVSTSLDLKLMQAVITDLGKNEAISPFVMSTLMTQIWLGAGGVTKSEISPVLGASESATQPLLSSYQSAIDYLTSGTSNVTTNVFNSIYVKSDISMKPTFTSMISTYFRAGVQSFTSEAQAASEINAAVANVTNNLIKELVDANAMKNAKAVLVSALYFKGLWKERFHESDTTIEPFLTNTGEIMVPMMSLETTRLPYLYRSDSFDAISLPYQDEDYIMVLLRPLQRSMAAVQMLKSSLNTLDIADIVSEMQSQRVDVSMPRFEIEAEYKNLETVFPTLGISTLFTDSADLSNMAYQSLKVSKIIMKVFINVTEEGTEAAGAGGSILVPLSLPPQFTLDRPFFAIVWNVKHSMNLFTAYVASP